MNNYLIWYVINGDIEPKLKSQYSASIHNYIFKSGIKIKSKSNAFIYKDDLSANEIADKIKGLAKENILLIVTEISNNYQGWLKKSQWDFLNND